MIKFYRWAYRSELAITAFEFGWMLWMLRQHEWVRAFACAGLTFGMGCMAYGVWITGKTLRDDYPLPWISTKTAAKRRGDER